MDQSSVDIEISRAHDKREELYLLFKNELDIPYVYKKEFLFLLSKFTRSNPNLGNIETKLLHVLTKYLRHVYPGETIDETKIDWHYVINYSDIFNFSLPLKKEYSNSRSSSYDTFNDVISDILEIKSIYAAHPIYYSLSDPYERFYQNVNKTIEDNGGSAYYKFGTIDDLRQLFFLMGKKDNPTIDKLEKIRPLLVNLLVDYQMNEVNEKLDNELSFFNIDSLLTRYEEMYKSVFKNGIDSDSADDYSIDSIVEDANKKIKTYFFGTDYDIYDPYYRSDELEEMDYSNLKHATERMSLEEIIEMCSIALLGDNNQVSRSKEDFERHLSAYKNNEAIYDSISKSYHKVSHDDVKCLSDKASRDEKDSKKYVPNIQRKFSRLIMERLLEDGIIKEGEATDELMAEICTKLLNSEPTFMIDPKVYIGIENRIKISDYESNKRKFEKINAFGILKNKLAQIKMEMPKYARLF